MRFALLLTLAACSGRRVASPHVVEHHDHGPAFVHGMVVFGEHGTYLSHLPLFHAPHDYQIVLAVGATDDGARIADAAATGERLYTYVPHAFALPRARAPGFAMTGAIVRGHFERGGRTLVEDVGMTVERVIHFRQFDAAAADESLTYLLFGGDDEAFLVHRITAAPDFDHVVEVASWPASIDPRTLAAGVVVRFPAHPRGEPLAPRASVEAELDGEPLALVLGDEIYLERAELAE